ncbi:DNA-3-methyladenine glycosylase 2 family protein [Prauserella endophytica]|uniref:DNA-3-methyladenine glycosylase II n=1 Tax=Prauserella endophytica TaxID=1592324 RepID=A0ABY2RUS0_9PSEU|nr:DNA-3-methyladenine glycosylase 2 family protein [Prauserella endophytica]TKG61319.1 DNA-3-methyladenine glycosylase 2 family protein [Prauserella endophytica]
MTQLTAPVPANQSLWHDTERCYRAVMSRDARFDGQFIVAVRTTGIYCRPSCPAMTPKARNVEFFPTSAAAQSRGYRACRRCLPDAVPGSPEWNVRADLAARAMRLIADGTVEREGVPGLARRLGYSERQLGRVLTAELGAGPLALARAHRAHSARLLIELSELPLTDVAFAAGFASVRQFNTTIREVFATTPTQLRAAAAGKREQAGPRDEPSAAGARLTLRLPFREPFDADGLFAFLAARAVPGVEDVTDGYRRTLRLPHGTGLVRLTPAERYVQCDLRLTDVRDLGNAVARVRRLLDLDADPEAVRQVLGADPALAPLVSAIPGMRVPGAVDGTELVLRAMLGQQVSVAAARTAAGRLASELGEPVTATDGEPGLLFPAAAAIAEHATEVLRGPLRRIEAIRDVATAIASGDLDVHVGREAGELRAELLAAPGIGPWTADYVLMRVLGQPDVLLDGDLAIRKGAAALGLDGTPAALTARAQAWRPWRSYAGMYLWRSSAPTSTKGNGQAP